MKTAHILNLDVHFETLSIVTDIEFSPLLHTLFGTRVAHSIFEFLMKIFGAIYIHIDVENFNSEIDIKNLNQCRMTCKQLLKIHYFRLCSYRYRFAVLRHNEFLYFVKIFEIVNFNVDTCICAIFIERYQLWMPFILHCNLLRSIPLHCAFHRISSIFSRYNGNKAFSEIGVEEWVRTIGSNSKASLSHLRTGPHFRTEII